jgi:ankyrin repeat protein
MDGVDVFTARLLEGTSSDDVEALNDLGVDNVTSYRDKHNSSALHYAAGYGSIQTCQWLLDCGLDPATASPHNGRTPLHWAARNGHSETCRLLIGKSNGVVDLHAKGQVTPLQLAAWQGHLDTCRLLVSLGANPLFLNGKSFSSSSMEQKYRTNDCTAWHHQTDGHSILTSYGTARLGLWNCTLVGQVSKSSRRQPCAKLLCLVV